MALLESRQVAGPVPKIKQLVEGFLLMLNRRKILLNSAILGAVSLLPLPSAHAAAYTVPDLTPPKGPWHTVAQIQRPGGQLNYAVAGPEDSGEPPIVMLHRLGGWIADWRHVAAIFAETRRVIAFDLPGHGSSVWEGPVPYSVSLPESAANVMGALDEMDIDKFDLIGTSLGGCISVVLAAMWPDRVNTVSIVSAALTPRRSIKQAKELVDDRQSHLFNLQGYPIKYDETLLTTTFGIEDTKDIYNESLASRYLAGLWIQPSERGVVTGDILGSLARLKAPTLVVYAENDRAYVKHRENAMKVNPEVTFKVIGESGAFAMQEDPETLAEILRGFIGTAGSF